jgi:hypothetical protein
MPHYRDGESAVKLAQRVCTLTNWQVTAHASKLAAAQTETGDFKKAIEIAERLADPNVTLYLDEKPVREQ